MNLKQTAVALALLIGLGLVFGFWASRTQPAEPAAQTLLPGERTPEQNIKYSEAGEYYTIEATYPEKVPLLTAQASAKARLAIEQKLLERIVEFKKNTNVENLSAEEADFLGLGGDRKYALALEYVDFDSPGRHSYLYTMYEDTGGAHPNTYFLTFVFNTEGNTVALSDLFVPGTNWLEELSLLVSNEVSAQYRARSGVDDLTDLLYAEGLSPKVQNFQNFVIDHDTLAIYIPPYQVAAYAAGAFEVRIPFTELQGLLK